MGRTKARDVKLNNTYSTLLPRLIETEKALRQIMGDVVEKKNSLRMQARYLQVRLNTCMEVNRTLLRDTDEPLKEIRESIDSLSGESLRLKEMSLFNREILRLKYLENAKKSKAFGGWGGMGQK